MPQSVAAWCRRAGHTVRYETYYGQQAPHTLLPQPLDIAFICAFTESAPLAYALSLLLRRQGVRTILGGPHARSFPKDAARFFDVVVKDCDEGLIRDCVNEQHPAGTVLSSTAKIFDFPSLAERRVDLDRVSLLFGRYSTLSVVPLVSSVGCPYDCDFCVDWNQAYRLRNADDLRDDLEYASTQLNGRTLAFYDPNFGVNFDKTVGVLEQIDPSRRNPYIMESSLSILKERRLARLRDTNCIYIAPGVESWFDYGKKAGTIAADASTKFRHIVDQFELIGGFVPGLQANFLFGTDADNGCEPAELTKSFIRKFPNVFPGVAFPIAFGGIPLRETLRQQGRLLPLPSCYYMDPIPTFRFKNYRFDEFFGHLISIFREAVSAQMLWNRMRARLPMTIRLAYLVRSIEIRRYIDYLQEFRRVLKEDRSVGAFNEANNSMIPAYYDFLLNGRLGRYADLLGQRDRHELVPE